MSSPDYEPEPLRPLGVSRALWLMFVVWFTALLAVVLWPWT